VLWLRTHAPATAVVGAAATITVVFFAVARPAYRPHVEPRPRDHGLPYTVARYTSADARRAFAAEGVKLSWRSRMPWVTTLGNRGDVLEIDVFRDRGKVEASGFYDYATESSTGDYVHFPRACGTSIPVAERWRGNVRVMVSCTAARSNAPAWLRVVTRALNRL
jgi:hypothetical protein